MPKYIPKTFENAVEALSLLPSIGHKSAQRMVLHILNMKHENTQKISEAIAHVKLNLKICNVCHAYSDHDKCEICLDPKRDQAIFCVVENPSDIFTIEESGQFNGLYHVLHGRISPLQGIGPNDIKIESLLRRLPKLLADHNSCEMVLAMNPDVEGDATALYLAKKLSSFSEHIKTSRIAMGIPMGSSLEYTDQITMGRAICERRPYSHI